MERVVVWLTGPPASGKTTIAAALHARLQNRVRTTCLDGDDVRTWLTADCDFTAEGRERNVLRVARVAKMIARHGGVVIVSLVSPFADCRARAYELIRAAGVSLVDVHVDASQELRIERDPKGLYARAIAGQLSGLTGYDAPYERPDAAMVYIDTDNTALDECVDQLMEMLKAYQGMLPNYAI